MAFADSNRVSLRKIEESTWGTTPGSGTTRLLRSTSSSLATNKETVVSDELRSDRMVSDVVEVSAMSGGDVSWEFSAGAHDEEFAAFLNSTFSRPMTQDIWLGSRISITANNTITWSGSDISAYFTAGRRIKLEGFNNPANIGYFQVTSASFSGGNTLIVVNVTSLVTESGTVATKLMDANDVIVLRNTDIRSGTSGASTFDSNSNDAFAAAVAAGQLVVGQKIHVSGLGYEAGTIALSGSLTAADAVTVSDGTNSKTFVAGTDYTLAGTANGDAAALAAAINAQRNNATNPVNVRASVATATITVTNLNVTGGALTEVTDGGSVITVTNFSGGDATQSGVFTLTAVGDDVLTVSPAPGTNANSGSLEVTIKGSHVRNPSNNADISQRSFSIQTGYEDIGQYILRDGLVPGTFNMEVSTGAIVTGSFTYNGRATAISSTDTLGNTGTYTVLEAPAGPVVNATTDVGDLVKDGAALSFCIQSLSVTGENTLRNQMCIGSKFPSGIGTGRFNLTGSMSVLFEDGSLFTDFLNHDTVSLSWSITDAHQRQYFFNIPSMKISTDDPSPGGIDQDIVEAVDFVAFRDNSLGTMFLIDRFSGNKFT